MRCPTSAPSGMGSISMKRITLSARVNSLVGRCRHSRNSGISPQRMARRIISILSTTFPPLPFYALQLPVSGGNLGALYDAGNLARLQSESVAQLNPGHAHNLACTLVFKLVDLVIRIWICAAGYVPSGGCGNVRCPPHFLGVVQGFFFAPIPPITRVTPYTKFQP